MLTLRYTQKTVPVIDRTELKGFFDIRLVLPAPSLPGVPRFAMPPSSAPNDPGVDLEVAYRSR